MAEFIKDFDINFRPLTILMLIMPCLMRSQTYGDVCTNQFTDAQAFSLLHAQEIEYYTIEETLRHYIQLEEECGLAGKTPLTWGLYDNSSDGTISFRISLSPALFSIDSEGTQDVTPQRISERKCLEYAKLTKKLVKQAIRETTDVALKNILQSCESEIYPLIGGGENAQKYEFPHMAAIGWRTEEGGYSFSCGGTLISTNFVLTAGHCTYDPKMKPNPIPAVVFIGDNHIDHDYHRTHNLSPFLIPIKEIRKHPNYNPPMKYNDIALMELEREVKFSLEVRPACLWNTNDFGKFTDTLVATGWGYTNSKNDKIPEDLQKVTLKFLDNALCCHKLRGYLRKTLFPKELIQTQMCTWDENTKKDICNGDSGGPLSVTKESCIHYVVGVMSFSPGSRLCQKTKPSVYTRVANYLDWIENVVWNQTHN